MSSRTAAESLICLFSLSLGYFCFYPPKINNSFVMRASGNRVWGKQLFVCFLRPHRILEIETSLYRYMKYNKKINFIGWRQKKRSERRKRTRKWFWYKIQKTQTIMTFFWFLVGQHLSLSITGKEKLVSYMVQSVHNMNVNQLFRSTVVLSSFTKE